MSADDRIWIDVTDLVEFWQRRESVSGVQRVIARTAPLILDDNPDAAAIVLDRSRGRFIALTTEEAKQLLPGDNAIDVDAMATRATALVNRAHTADPIVVRRGDVVIFLGAVWISDALMLAARDVHAQGARCVYLLYDLTPVLQAGHTATVNKLFERYLQLIVDTGSRIPAISESSRRDLETYVAQHSSRLDSTPPGAATKLPCGIAPEPQGPNAGSSPWPRAYVLFVGTIESRKNHMLALRAWEELIRKHGVDGVPDLICIGRLGWHANEFLDAYVRSRGLDGKISVLSSGVSDEELRAFYSNAEFTVYPSNYEGWGLPVSESLAFGKVVVTTHSSSMPEAGGNLACYFTPGDLHDFVETLEREGFDLSKREATQERIAEEFTDQSWRDVAEILTAEIAHAKAQEWRTPMFPVIELGQEVMLATPGPTPDPGYADEYLAHLQTEGLTPMLRQPRGTEDFRIVDAAVIGTLGSPQTWGLEARPGNRIDIRVQRPVDGPLVLLIATRAMPGVAAIEAVGPGGPVNEEVYLGSVLTLPLGDGKAGEPAQVNMTVTDAQDSVEGFLGLRSFVVLRADDLHAQVIAHKAAADALRQELDFIQNTRSWKATAPLRKWKGRGAQ